MSTESNNNEELNPQSTDYSSEMPDLDRAAKIETKFLQLNTSFEKVEAVENAVNKEDEMIKEAKRLEIPLDNYRRMFESYRQSLDNSLKLKSLLKPVSWLDNRFGNFVDWLGNISLIKFSVLIGEATLLAAMVSYITDGPQREQQAINDARDAIRDREGQVYTQSRIDALKFLNQNCASAIGIAAPKASMPKLELNNCYKFNLNLQSFDQWPPQFYRYQGMDMSYGNLAGADLKGANLKEANLNGINLAGADLTGANLAGANLAGANLAKADLRQSNLTGANLTGANLDQVRLGRSNLQGANLKGAKITNARLLWVDFSGANLALSNLEGSNLSRAKLHNVDLYNANLKNANLNKANLTDNTMLIGANLDGANLTEVKFWSVDQVKRGINWEKAVKDPDWENLITNPPIKKPKVGLVKYSVAPIFTDYQKGIEKVSGVEVVTVESEVGIENELKSMRKLIAANIDILIFRPSDPVKSSPVIREAYDLGIIPIAVGDCLNREDSEFEVFACYESNSFEMGYESALYLTKSASKRLPGKQLNIGLIDGSNAQRIYPYFKGFMSGLKASKESASWKIVSLTDAGFAFDKEKVVTMLQNHPEINVLWGGSDTTTDLAINVVKELGLSDKVLIYGILYLTPDYNKMLLDPQHPLQLLMDENPQKAAEEATKKALSILNRGVTKYGYDHHLFPHRLVTKDENINPQK